MAVTVVDVGLVFVLDAVVMMPMCVLAGKRRLVPVRVVFVVVAMVRSCETGTASATNHVVTAAARR